MAITIANLKYVEPTNTLIDMDVTFDPPMSPDEIDPIPFTYHPDDQEPISLAVRELLQGCSYSIILYVPSSFVTAASNNKGSMVSSNNKGSDVIA